LCGTVSKGLSNSSMKSNAFGQAVIFYLVFCFFVICSLEFWLICKEDMFSSCPFPSVSCFPFSFMTMLWVLKFRSTGSMVALVCYCVVCQASLGSWDPHPRTSPVSLLLLWGMEMKSLWLCDCTYNR